MISIEDSDESNSSSDRLQIVDHSSDSNKAPEPKPEAKHTEHKENIPEVVEKAPSPVEVIKDVQSAAEVDKPVEVIVQCEKVDKPVIESPVDPLNQANLSLMTDDNSGVESDKSDLNLNYSDGSDKDKQDAPKETGNLYDTLENYYSRE